MESIFERTAFLIHEARFALLDAGWSRTVFPYPHHRIYYITGGEARLILNDRVLPLRKDHIYLLPAFSLVEAICEDRMDQYYIHFQTVSTFAYNLFEMYKPALEVLADAGSKERFMNIMAHYEQDTLHARLTVMGCFHLILAPFFAGAAPPDPSIERFGDVLCYIESHLSDPISVGMLAGLLDLHPVYFSNLFSRTFGLPPTGYIMKKRLERAQSLLAHTGGRIREIAARSGFPNEMYFSRVFRDKTGMTPGAYRRHFHPARSPQPTQRNI